MVVRIGKIILNMPLFSGIMRMFLPLFHSPSTTAGLATRTIAIAIILLASNVSISNAQQQVQQLTTQTSVIENATATNTAVSTEDSFRVQIPPGWVIHDVKNTGFPLGVEVLRGYGILAQICPADQQQQGPQGASLSDAGSEISGSDSNSNTTTTTTNNCQGAQKEIIHILRYPNLGARLGLASDDIIRNEDGTADVILAYQMQKLQQAGYQDITIVNNTDATIDVDLSTGLNNNTMAASWPAKLVKMTYSTNAAPDETRTGYFISTATDLTPQNLGMITGYGIFYEGSADLNDPVQKEQEQQQSMMQTGGLVLVPLTSAGQVFNSFELIAAAEAVQAILAAQRAQGAQAAEEEPAPEDALTVEIDSSGTEGVAPATFELEADITGGTEPYTIVWDLDDDGAADSNEQTVVPTFNEAGTYNVVLAVRDSEGQVASDTLEITIEEGEEEEASTEEEVSTTGEDVEEPLIQETQEEETSCDSSYPDRCIPPSPPNLTCNDVGASNFEVLPPDPHQFDGDNDGIGCEIESNEQAGLDEEPDRLGSNVPPGLGGLINRVFDRLNSSSSL
jgi:PKD repeat protein